LTGAMTATSSQMLAEETETNRRIAIDFMKEAAAGRAREMMREYAAPDFVHHNPYFASDAESLAAAMDENHRDNPRKRFEILRTVAEGPMVVLHGRVQHKPEDEPIALVHIFRIEDGRIHELWDLDQEPQPNSPNEKGLF